MNYRNHQNSLIKKKPGKFIKKKWHRLKSKTKGGGGEMAIMKGRIFEKVGVNISTVYGKFPKDFKNQIPGCEKNANFWAAGGREPDPLIEGPCSSGLECGGFQSWLCFESSLA